MNVAPAPLEISYLLCLVSHPLGIIFVFAVNIHVLWSNGNACVGMIIETIMAMNNGTQWFNILFVSINCSIIEVAFLAHVDNSKGSSTHGTEELSSRDERVGQVLLIPRIRPIKGIIRRDINLHVCTAAFRFVPNAKVESWMNIFEVACEGLESEAIQVAPGTLKVVLLR